MHRNRKSETDIRMYWKAYGGFRAFIVSKYSFISLVITIFCFDHWSSSNDWMEEPFTILPSLLGFTLAGYAMWLSVGNESLKTLLSNKYDKSKNEFSFFMQINASFIHFVLLQIITLIYIYFIKYNSLSVFYDLLEKYYVFFNITICIFSILNFLASAFGFFLFIYSILTMLATVLGIFRISFWIDQKNFKESNKYKKCADCYADVPSQAKKCMYCNCEFISKD